MPKVSVIIPVYNKEKYLENTISSVLNQKFQDFEVIAVNDGSTDRSPDILRRFAAEDARLRIVDIPNGGVSHARNVGMEAACGEWIQFLDADDCLEHDYLFHAVPAAEACCADILFSEFIKKNEAGNPTETVRIPVEGCLNQTELCDCFAVFQYQNGFFGFISNKLFRRDIWKQSGARFPEGTTLAEDLDFYVRLYPSVQNAYFWNGNSFSYLQTDENYLCRTAVDYCTQILIHMDIRAWFIHSGRYQQHRDILDRKVAEYAFFVLFHHEECGKSLTEAFDFLTSHRDIMDCLRPDLLTGFSKKIVCYLKKENLFSLKILLGGREQIRKLYRMVKRNG